MVASRWLVMALLDRTGSAGRDVSDDQIAGLVYVAACGPDQGSAA
ncbi:MAG: hypothetical protein ACYDHH_25985 [Solirubrobacteraceae bacterium]